jgi:hypothetical protein
MDQRVAVRFAGNYKTSCQLLKDKEGEWLPAWVRDISATGINVLMERQFEPGTLLLLELENPETQKFSRTEMVVIHTMECPNGDWFHGGAFAKELSPEELHAFV